MKEETFVSEFEASKTDYKDPSTNRPYVKMKEPSYFFRLSKYHHAIVKHLQEHPNFIIGPNDILNRLTLNDPLTDISISRTSIEWGIPLPQIEGDEGKHVFYVCKNLRFKSLI